MHKSFMATMGVSLAVAGTLLATMAAPSAQRRRGDANVDAGMPVATGRILQDPEEYYGRVITMSAGVEQVLSKTAFLMDQRKAVGGKEVKAVGKPVLVIAPYLTGTFDQKNYIVVRGELVKFDHAALARLAPGYTLDLPAEIGAKYNGQPVLVANSVIDSKHVEIGKKPITPPRPEEVSMSELMKTISPAFAALRTAADESKAAVVAENAAKLKPAFTQTATIWGGLGKKEAAELAQAASVHVASIETAAAAGNWDAVKTSAGALSTQCQSCHTAYRQREEDGTYRFKTAQ